MRFSGKVCASLQIMWHAGYLQTLALTRNKNDV
jgi:hypothetical protein